MKLPTFLVIGVEKAGTTSIYHYLKQHPEIYMSPIKETNFLERDWEQVDAATRARKKDRIDTVEKYSQLFADVTHERAIGEVSPNYLFHHASSIDRIQRYVPNAKLVAILRHPAERAYSDYLMHLRDGIRPEVSLTEQLKTRSNSSFTLRKGFYYHPLTQFIDRFGRDRLHVILYDDFCHSPATVMQDLYRFLGVDATFLPDMSQRSQVAKVPKSQTVNLLLRNQNPVRSLVAAGLKTVLPLPLRQHIRSTLINWNSASKDQAPFPAEERQQLIELYRDDILSLQDLLQRDLSTWLT
ncbi:sulfotransferase [Oculatella sp. LEGE 06141]|nr:sulfotransferase [Oculatella sp. LEGE 06141]